MVSKCALIKKQADKKVNLFFLFQLVLQKVSSDVCPDGQVMLLVSLAVMFLLCKSDVMCSTHAPSRRTSLGKAEHHADRHITFHAVEHIVRRVSLRTLGVCRLFYCDDAILTADAQAKKSCAKTPHSSFNYVYFFFLLIIYTYFIFYKKYKKYY